MMDTPPPLGDVLRVPWQVPRGLRVAGKRCRLTRAAAAVRRRSMAEAVRDGWPRSRVAATYGVRVQDVPVAPRRLAAPSRLRGAVHPAYRNEQRAFVVDHLRDGHSVADVARAIEASETFVSYVAGRL